jgi:hypothetical protein
MVVAFRIVRLLAIVLTALTLVPLGAHLASMPNKIHLSAEQYFLVQSSYEGWFLFAFVQIPSVIVAFALAFMQRAQALPFRLAMIGAGAMAATLAIYFTWVNPANLATHQWTLIPDNWQALRLQWEYGHAASAVLNLIALCAITLAVVASPGMNGARGGSPESREAVPH